MSLLQTLQSAVCKSAALCFETEQRHLKEEGGIDYVIYCMSTDMSFCE